MLLLYFQDLGRLLFFHLNAQNECIHTFFFFFLAASMKLAVMELLRTARS